MPIKVTMSGGRETTIPTYEELPDSVILKVQSPDGSSVAVVCRKRRGSTGSWGFGSTEPVTLIGADGTPVAYQGSFLLTVRGSVPEEKRAERATKRAAILAAGKAALAGKGK